MELFVACDIEKNGISIDMARIPENNAGRIIVTIDGNEESNAIRIWNATQKDCEYSLYQYANKGTVTCVEHETRILPEPNIEFGVTKALKKEPIIHS